MSRVKVKSAGSSRRTEKETLPQSIVGLRLGNSNVLAPGYHRLSDAPEVAGAVWRLADLVSSMSIHLMENRTNGDVRVHDELARKLDYEPYSLTDRATWLGWIVSTMVLEGEAFVLPMTAEGLLSDLMPMPGAKALQRPDGGYGISWHGCEFDSADVLHFRYRPDPLYPWRGLGPRVQLQTVVESLVTADRTKLDYMTSEYKPPLIVSVNADSDLADEAKRTALIEQYLKRSSPDEPWIIPADLLHVETVKPLSLNDLAIKDGIELDKKSVASVLGVPGFVVGVGAFNRDEYNNFVATVIMHICEVIQQTLTRGLVISPRRYVRLNVRSLYSYSLTDLADIGGQQYDRGLMTGNEVRHWLGLDPLSGLDELRILENYIPVDKVADQKKLKQEE